MVISTITICYFLLFINNKLINEWYYKKIINGFTPSNIYLVPWSKTIVNFTFSHNTIRCHCKDLIIIRFCKKISWHLTQYNSLKYIISKHIICSFVIFCIESCLEFYIEWCRLVIFYIIYICGVDLSFSKYSLSQPKY